MTPEEIVAKFYQPLDQFEPIVRQPSDSDFTWIREVIVTLLIRKLYDETGVVHNLIGLIRLEAAYIIRYGVELPEPAMVGAYDPFIDNNATAVIRART